jgi:hypothetical protein
MIIYAVIARANDATVFTESQQELKGNAAQVTLSLLEHLRDHPELIQEGERKTIVHCNEIENDFFSHFAEACSAILNDSDGPDEYFFHLYLKDGVVYCCLGDDSDGREQTVYVAMICAELAHFCSFPSTLTRPVLSFIFIFFQQLCLSRTHSTRVYQNLQTPAHSIGQRVLHGQEFQTNFTLRHSLPQH